VIANSQSMPCWISASVDQAAVPSRTPSGAFWSISALPAIIRRLRRCASPSSA
jgi:hypothetical protein